MQPLRRSVATPLGPVTLSEAGGAITRLDWVAEGADDTPLLREACGQIEAYFAGRLRVFDLPLRVEASPAQRAACAAMAAIAYGETETYGALAKALGVSAQAMGQLCGGNPLPILVPCHRVLAAGGALGGFSAPGGVETKLALLRLEGAAVGGTALLL